MIRYFVILFLVSLAHSKGQNRSIENEVNSVASLIEHHQYEEAEKKTNSLISTIDNQKNDKKNLKHKLHLQALLADMYEHNEENTKALDLILKVVDEANKNNYHAISCQANITLALIYEKEENSILAKKHLDIADEIRKKHKLNQFYGAILVRRSLYHRWFSKKQDSAMYYAKKALSEARKYNRKYDEIEAQLMIGIYNGQKGSHLDAIDAFKKVNRYYKKINSYNDVASMFYNISFSYNKLQEYEMMKIHLDSSDLYYDKVSPSVKIILNEKKITYFEHFNIKDSIIHYLKLNLELKDQYMKEEEASSIKKITEQFDNDKKEATIKSKNKQMIYFTLLLIVIFIGAFLLFIQNRKINSRNKIINKQLIELSRTLEQKQVLLSELQHRVKNNLQHVISILEIQKESVNFNNIDELIRGNQNRIHSMALLHKKLNVFDNVNEIDLSKYITELSELVKDSYHSDKKNIQLNINCEVPKLSLEKALPIGLIIVELVSNSLKHAFRKYKVGIINIEITFENDTYKLYYNDNGPGYDFYVINEKGLGQEIIKGLIEQLNGIVETKNEGGFELTIYFK